MLSSNLGRFVGCCSKELLLQLFVGKIELGGAGHGGRRRVGIGRQKLKDRTRGKVTKKLDIKVEFAFHFRLFLSTICFNESLPTHVINEHTNSNESWDTLFNSILNLNSSLYSHILCFYNTFLTITLVLPTCVPSSISDTFTSFLSMPRWAS